MKTKSMVLSRRQFLVRSTAVAVAVQYVPGEVLGLNGAVGANERLNIGGVGVGGQGASDLSNMESENLVALCDVDWGHAAGTFKKYSKAKQYRDFRVMLDEQKDLDAVVVATPDHMHAFAAMAAIRQKKHVYCEKPLTHSVWEARQLAEAARAAGVATQMGNQGQASEDSRRLSELVWGGAIGRVVEAHVWTDRPSNGLFGEYWPQGVDRPKDTPPSPGALDWNLWLGPAPERPYHPAYLPFKWRGWWDFGTGALGDIGCHALDPVFRALKLGSPIVWRSKRDWADGDVAPGKCVHPVTVQASSSRVNKETFPLASKVTYEFAGDGGKPGIRVVWTDGGIRPARPTGLPDEVEMGANGRLLIGEEGFLLGTRLYPDARRGDFKDSPKTIPRSVGHYKEWIAACKGGAPAGSNFDWAGPLAEIVLLGNAALRMQVREEVTFKALRWDPVGLRFSNSDEATKYLRREYRAGWSLA